MSSPAKANDSHPGLRLGGLTPLTTIDFPGRLAAVLYCQGCPWRCRYCHNGHLVDANEASSLKWPDVLTFLRRRRGLLDGVVFSGGEPTAQRALLESVGVVRDLGFQIGLHTSGSYPRRLAEVLPLVDWVGLDIKAPPEDYPALTGVPGSGDQAFESLELLLASGKPHEIRITVHSTLLPAPKLSRLMAHIRAHGARHVVLQPCGDHSTLDPALAPNRLEWSERQVCAVA